MTEKLAKGVVHVIPPDMRLVLCRNAGLPDIWNSLTPLGRNEWICWVTYVKKKETRSQHLERLVIHLNKGKRRPCCWAGCPHRLKTGDLDK
jgi:uncharacterized protein YdeI (YjbR/CyaY-like superfamily)